MTPARFALTVLLAAAIALGAVVGARASPGSIARGLAADPVYVARGARPGLSVAQRGKLRLQILHEDLGRIRFAVVPAAEARGAGGIGALANAVDRRLRRRGATVLVAGSSVYIVVSYPNADGAAAVLRRAFAASRGASLYSQLRRAVDGLARLDPGTDGDADRGDTGAPAAPPISLEPFRKPLGIVKTVQDTFRWVGIAIGAAVALPFLILGFVLLRGLWRRRREDRETLRSGRAEANRQLVSLGDDIRALDIDVSMPGADAAGVASYGQALESYEQAERALEHADSPQGLRNASAFLAQARSQMDAAQARLGRPAATPAPSTPAETADAADRALGRP